MNFEQEFIDSIPHLSNIDGWRNIFIEENREPLYDIQSIGNPRLIFSKHYHALNYLGATEKCYLRQTIVEKLDRIAKRLPKGFSLLIFDGWRSFALQNALYENVKKKMFVEHNFRDEQEAENYVSRFVARPSSNPLYPSPHLTGGSVDLTICKNGQELNMGTYFDDSTEIAHTEYFEEKLRIGEANYNVEVRNNRRMLYFAMNKEGFTSYKYEWWHFDYGNQVWGATRKRNAVYGIVDLVPS